MSDKTALRAAARAARKTSHGRVDLAPATLRLLDALKAQPGPVAFYWPIRTEIDPRPAMKKVAVSQDVCLPVTEGYGPLTFRSWTPGTLLEKDDFGTEFPTAAIEVVPVTLVVPMLAFDRRGHRLGYGAGHYDRTLDGLRQNGAIKAIGFAYAGQEIARVPNEATDQPLDLIVTEAETITPSE